MTNMVIGVGGAGVKALEAFVYMMAAGVWPQGEVKLGIVDQDQTNGSLTSAEKTIVDYAKLLGELRGGGSDHLGSSDLFGGAIGFDRTQKWSPAVRMDESLARIVGFPNEADESLKDLFSALFEPGRNEMDLVLNEGFRGRPFLGAAVILHRTNEAIENQDALWGELRRMLDDQKNPVHCVLVGSIFGGTGASGLPTIAKQLRKMAARAPDRLRLNSILLIPYFSYVDEVTGQVAARSADSLSRAGNALRYYSEIINEGVEQGQRPLFDRTYVVGWNPAIELLHKSDGGPEQKNPPMMPEVLAGLGAIRLLSSELRPEEVGTFSLLGRSDSKPFGWLDIPEIGSSSMTRERIRQFIRFSLAFRYFYSDAMQKDVSGDLWRERARHEFGVDFRKNATKALLGQTAAFCDRFLQWMVALQWADPIQRGADTRAEIDLVKAETFAYPHTADKPNLKEAQERAALKSVGEADLKKLKAAFTKLCAFEEEDPTGPPLADIFYRFSNASRPKRSRGLGSVLGSLYEACAAPRI